MPDSSYEIVIFEETIEQQASGAITGVLFIKLSHRGFPDDRWNDFIVTVLRWWLAAAARLANTTLETESFEFMDGPFRIECVTGGELVFCRCVDRRGSMKTLASFQTTVGDLCSKVVAAAHRVLEACRNKGISSGETELLSRDLSLRSRR